MDMLTWLISQSHYTESFVKFDFGSARCFKINMEIPDFMYYYDGEAVSAFENGVALFADNPIIDTVTFGNKYLHHCNNSDVLFAVLYDRLVIKWKSSPDYIISHIFFDHLVITQSRTVIYKGLNFHPQPINTINGTRIRRWHIEDWLKEKGFRVRDINTASFHGRNAPVDLFCPKLGMNAIQQMEFVVDSIEYSQSK